MSLVAKFFVVFNMIVSVVFMIFAANVWTAQTKWQRMYELEKGRNVQWAAQFQKEQVELWKQVVKEQETVAKRDEEVVRVKLEKSEIRDRFLAMQSELSKLTNKVEVEQALAQEAVRAGNRYSEELLRLKGVLVKQQQAVVVERQNATEARNEKSNLENELNVNKQAFAALNRDKRVIEEDLALQTRRMERLMEILPVADLLGGDFGSMQAHVADAQVLAVRPDVNLIMLSVGSAQNVKPGYRFTISRGSDYIGKAEVVKVYPDMSSARLIPELINKKGFKVEINDEAKSK